MQYSGPVRNVGKMKKFLKINLPYILVGLAIFAIYCLRFVNLTKIPVFADEAIYIRWAQIMKAEETLRFLPLSDGKEPLFMWLMIPFFKIFSDPLFAGRMVSVLAGFLSMFGIGLLSYLLFKNKKVSFLAAFIYVISPFTFFFDRMSLVDSVLSMFGIWTFIFSYLAITRRRLDFAMLAGFTLGGAWLTKSTALFFALMIPTLIFFVKWEKGFKKNFLVIAKSIALVLVTVVIGYGFYNILRLGPNFHLISSRNMDYVYPISHFLVSPFNPLKSFLIAASGWIYSMGPAPILALALIGIAFNFKKYWRQVLILTFWFLVPIMAQAEFAKTFTARYILFTIPYLIILAASAFGCKFKKWQNIVLYAFFAAFVFLAGRFNFWLLTNPYKANLPRSERSGYLEEWTAGQGIKETADYLISEQIFKPNEKIVIGTEGYFGTLPDGLQIYLNKYPEITAIGVGLNFEKIPSQLINARNSGDTTYLLVNASRFHNDPEKMGLEKVMEFPKAVRPNGTRDSLVLYLVL